MPYVYTYILISYFLSIISMKKTFYISGLSLAVIAVTGINSSFASSENTLPPEFSVLTSTELSTLSTLTGSERDTFLESKGITRPELSDSGSTHPSHIKNDNTPELNLTDAEKTALENMTDIERDAFFASKWLSRPTASGEINWQNSNTGKQSNQKNGAKKNQIQKNTSKWTNEEISQNNKTRAERIVENKAKALETKKVRIQKKISSNESLTRLEKKFADANSIEY